jgi:hypothetical protein
MYSAFSSSNKSFLSGRVIEKDYPDGVNDTWNVSENSQDDIDQKLNGAASIYEYCEWLKIET